MIKFKNIDTILKAIGNRLMPMKKELCKLTLQENLNLVADLNNTY
jgi:hypothetical protein